MLLVESYPAVPIFISILIAQERLQKNLNEAEEPGAAMAIFKTEECNSTPADFTQCG